MILLIDNYDSFTFNLVQLFQKLGAFPIVMRNDNRKIFDFLEKKELEAVVISPGPGSPKTSGLCVEFLQKLSPTIPVLGVCLGHQILGHVAGYEIKKKKNIMHGKTSYITYKPHIIFSDIENPFKATRYHSLVIGEPEKKTSLSIEIIARSKDGEIMGISYKDRPWIGIQFHPESILSTSGPKIIENFIKKVVGGTK